jgi:hypothetical protein
MIRTARQYVDTILEEVDKWRVYKHPWFRGESGNDRPLTPKIADHDSGHENYLLQSFRRKAGGLSNAPPRDQTDIWLFWAQHHGIPTRLLDWSESALAALYFAVNRRCKNPRVYLLDPHHLNEYSVGPLPDILNYPLIWQGIGAEYVALAWVGTKTTIPSDLPFALPATYFDERMIAQKSCFTVHNKLDPLIELLQSQRIEIGEILHEYQITSDDGELVKMLHELDTLGTSGATLFPDLDHLAGDIKNELIGF